RRRLDNPPVEVTIALLSGYFAYLPAAAIGVSGVLAVVTVGVYMGWRTPELTSVQTRLDGAAMWQILTFVVNALLFGLVGLPLHFQGLPLPFVIRTLGVEADHLDEKEESKARIHAADAALARLEELVDEDWVRPDTADRLRRQMGFRRNRFAARFSTDDDGAIEEQSQAYQRLLRELLDAERAAVVALRREGRINDDVMHRVTRDLDLEDARLDA